MMDWGLDRLERNLLGAGYGDNVAATYDWERNLIVVYRNQILYPPLPDRDFEAECREWFSKVRSNGFVLDTGEVISGFDVSRYASFFGHIGYEREIQAVGEDDALKALDALIQLEFKVWGFGEDYKEAKPLIECSGKLLAAGFSVSRQ